jgi:hypothetical protein
MAKETETPVPKPALSDTNARDQFIAAALKEIVSWQLAENKINHDMAGAYAVRYANAAMATRAAETAPLKVVVAKGAVVPVVVEPPPTPPDDGEKQPPKSIAEIIGEPAAELTEVK